MILKKLKCTLFCNAPYRLMPYIEEVEEGTLRRVECPKCGAVYSVFNKHNESLR